MPERAEPDDRAPFQPPPGAPRRAEPKPIPLSEHLPALILLAAIWAAWLWHLPRGGMTHWGLSAALLAAGQYENIGLHMFAHAGLMHIGFNSVVLFALSAPLLSYMGPAPFNWLRYYSFYALAGLAGAALYLAFHPAGSIPMLGASGAISGLIGLVSRLSDERDELIPLFSDEMGRRIWRFVRAHLWLVALITVPILLLGGSGGIAWEAHAGGFIAGLLGARFFLVGARS